MRIVYRYEENGTHTRSVQHDYKVLTAAGVDGWGETEARWSTWRMDRPEIHAKVTSAAGVESALDPSILSEAAAYPEAPEMYADERVLRGPLPNVTVGSSVDERIVSRTNQPFLGNAEAHTEVFQVGVPRERVELVIDVPEKMAIRFENHGADVKTTDVRQGGRRVITFAGGPYPAIAGLEDATPPDVAAWPHVSFTTGTAWKPLAALYAHMVDEKIAAMQLDGVVAGIASRSDTQAEKVRKILAWVRERVRYVGIEFGDSSIIPRGPRETLDHGYGDCKDQAVLVVGLLRAAGVSSKVALLDAGLDEDIDAELPALNLFDHAIVIIPGSAPVWIDPTATRTRGGELPVADQGRYALVVDPDTEGLVRTPRANEQQNTYRELRQVFVPEKGGARVLETATATGSIEQGLRDLFDVNAADRAKWLKEYVSRTYSSQTLGRLETSKLDDLAKPLSTVIEAHDSELTSETLLASSVDVSSGPVFGWIPKVLIEEGERKGALLVASPYRAELVYEVHPSAGFVLDGKPDTPDVPMGPAAFGRKIEERPDGVVVVTYTFVLPKSVWTAKEVNDFRKAYTAFGNTTLPPLSFVHEGEKQHRVRHFDKELEIYRRDVRLHPDSATTRMRLAHGLIGLGFGASARKIAAEAMKLAPDDGLLWGYAGYIRSRDLLGRGQKPGWDHEGSTQAYREALRVEPSRVFAATQLALMLEYNDAGQRYGTGSKLDEAAAILDHLDPAKLAEYENGTYVDNALFDLFWSGRFADVRARLEKMDPKKVPPVVAIVSAAMIGGANAGLSEAARLPIADTARADTLVVAAEALVAFRAYPEATALLSAAASSSSNEQLRQRLDVIRKTRKIDIASVPTNTPEAVVRKLFAVCGGRPASLKEDLRRLAPQRSGDASDTRTLTEFCDAIAVGVRRGAEKRDGRPLPNEVLADILFVSPQVRTEGNDRVGYRVKTSFGPSEMSFFVVREGGEYRVTFGNPPDMGCDALDMHKAGRDDAATQWLKWARELHSAAEGDDRLSGKPFVWLWTDKKDDVALDAAALCAETRRAPDQIVPTLRAARANASGDRALSIDLAVALAYADGKHDQEALTEITKVESEASTSTMAWHLKRHTLARLGRLDELRAESSARLSKDPTNVDRLSDLANAESMLGHFREARKLGERQATASTASADASNMQAWLSLYTENTSEQDLNYALRAVNANPKNPAYLNTLAAVDIALGHTADARERFVRSLELREDGALGDSDWYVFGRIAETLGLPDEAKAAYAKVSPGEKENGQYTVAHLVEARLRAMR
jgi:tetratricopeptide (TPR) repeat protein